MQTPLFGAHAALGARMAPFAGWDMPIQYDGILAEHTRTRQAASVFDICHMGEFEARGPTALADLERLLTQPVATLAVGQCRYGYLLRDDGGVRDDLTCYRLGPDRFWLVVNAGTTPQDAAWIRQHIAPTTQFTDLSADTGKLDIQGPTARVEMEKAFDLRLPELGYFRFIELRLDGVPCLLSRTGYTGEFGYELYGPASAMRAFWDRLLQRSAIRPAGLGARDTLRLEMGYPLYGHELSAEQTPAGASRGRYINMAKDFIGRPAVAAELAQPRQWLVGLQLDARRAARAHDPVAWNGRAVGVVTSGSFAPSLGVAVALAYVAVDAAQPGQRLTILTRGGELPATAVTLPFYRHGTARGAPPPP
ncbi:MAG: glycine cleavage system aminomethyltransferase GcvT [Kiritimatiellaeota bacterium]|nr:glycine cleavage system aminomethyltransferase GcvT [Kiritimatiellota bacterium]